MPDSFQRPPATLPDEEFDESDESLCGPRCDYCGERLVVHICPKCGNAMSCGD